MEEREKIKKLSFLVLIFIQRGRHTVWGQMSSCQIKILYLCSGIFESSVTGLTPSSPNKALSHSLHSTIW